LGQIYTFLSKWTKIDDLLCAYSQPVFEKVAARHKFGPRACGVIGTIACVAAMVFLLGTGAMGAVLVKQFYLEAYGIEAPATVMRQATHTTSDRRGNVTRWRTIEYEYNTREGTRIASKISRPVQELAGVPRGNRLTTRYWEPFATINLPRGAHADATGIGVVGLFALLIAAHMLLLARRFFRWRRHVLAAGAPAAAPMGMRARLAGA
jgi:hypothetical protein